MRERQKLDSSVSSVRKLDSELSDSLGLMEMAEAERLNERLVHLALSFDGTCTGEHGIGCGKIDFLLAEHGEAVSVMRAIKKAIDPDNIMNPGKILDLS